MDSLTPLVRFQLKYCERCGGLWLRPDGALTPYCPSCRSLFADLPLRAPRHPHDAAAAVMPPLLLLLSACQQAVAPGWCA